MLPTFSYQIFQELLNDDLVMGRMQLPLSSNNESIRIENKTINCLQLERLQLIEWLLYKNSVEDLLLTWSNNIHQMALDSVLQKKTPIGL